MISKPRTRGAHLHRFDLTCIPAALLLATASYSIAAAGPAAVKPAAPATADTKPTPKVTWPQTDIDRVVTDAAGKPVENAKVTWYGILINAGMPDPSTIKTVALATATTDSAGRFHIDAKTAWSASAFAEAWVQADGYAMAGQVVTAQGPPMSSGKTPIVLTQPTAVHFRVVDAQNHPIPGLAVRAFILQKERQTALIPEAPENTVISAADGGVDFKGLPQGWDLMLQVQDDRFAQLDFQKGQIHLAAAPKTDAPDLQLKTSAILEGNVTYGPAGKPAAGIRVIASEHSPHGSPPATAVTDAAGHFKLARIGGGTYSISVQLLPPANEQWVSPEISSTVPAGGHKTGLKIALAKGTLITGHVSYAESHKPAAGIRVSVGHSKGNVVSSSDIVTTDTGGNFKTRVLPGIISLYPQVETPVSSVRVEAVEGKTAVANIEIPTPIPPITIKGVVLDSAGKPAANADVYVATTSYNTPPPTTTDNDGKFTVSVSNASMVFLRARQERNATTSDKAALDGDNVTLKLTDNALSDVTGTVADTDGKPITGATVSLYQQSLRMIIDIPSATTDAAGTYHFTGLMPNTRYGASVSMKGYGSGSTGDIVLQPGTPFAASKVTLKAANSFVGGHIVDSHGSPLSGATVSWMDNQETKTTTDKSGKFRLNGVPPGDVVLQVNAPDEGTAQQVQAGKENIVIKTFSQKPDANQGANQPKEISYVGKYAPEFTVANWVNVSPITMQDLHGKIIIFDCWGCCADNLFETQRVVQQFGDRGVVGIGLNVAGGSLADVQAHVAQEHLTMPIAIDKDNGNGTAKGLGTNGFEAYALVDRNGKIAYTGWDFPQMLQTLGKMLAAERAAAAK